MARRTLNAPREPIVRVAPLRWLEDAEHHRVLVREVMLRASVSVWIATANVKDMHVEAPVGSAARARGRYVSLLDLLAGLATRGVELRMLHAAPPSRAFAASLRTRRVLEQGGLLLRRCARVHMKMLVVDGRFLYVGSANFTGAGLGAKAEGRRNFETGFLTEDDVLLDAAQARFDRIWTGGECGGCRVRMYCAAPLDTAAGSTAGGADRKPRCKPNARPTTRLGDP
ncbi:MAG: phospholipase D family protein [Polyangiaceae bacterium]|jgi:phosphatidylserine/phosphatidylglycerophosphate/cardiolipin synthase-like enzyme|nr:phospholipase D family protein [Polyangiaceae bacterium]